MVLVASRLIVIVLFLLFLIFLPKIYSWYVGLTDDQMDSVAKTNKKSDKRAKKRNK